MNKHRRQVNFQSDPPRSVSTRQEQDDFNHSLVHSVSLKKFDGLVHGLGGDPARLIKLASPIGSSTRFDGTFVAYRDFIRILHLSAMELGCPSFGLQLARLQSEWPILPVSMDLAMRNSHSVGAAYQYCSEHLQSYSPTLHTRIEQVPDRAQRFIAFEILLDRAPHQQQAVEHAVALLHFSVKAITNGALHSRGICFRHSPMADCIFYDHFFRTKVSFEMPANGILLSNADWDRPLSNRNPHLYEVATNFIETQFPSRKEMLSRQVKSIILRTLGEGGCTSEQVATVLGLHVRSMQRHLKDEGTSFELLRDGIRRDVALQYLAQPNMALIRIAGLLGYSEQSVFTRSCHRWFQLSPQRMRQRLQDKNINKRESLHQWH